MINELETELKGDILIVDDVPENLELLFNMLTKHNHEVRRVLNGKQALKIAEIDAPDLILLDIRMPEIDGYEICEKLKSSPKTKDIPVIFLSALNDSFDKVKAFEVGGVDYINKPFNLEEVMARVENQLKILKFKQQLEQKNLILLKTNQQLEQQKNELEIANKELEAFNSRVCHDIRNHLQAITGFSGLLLDDNEAKLNSDFLENITLINEAGENIAQIIEDLKRLSEVNNFKLNINSVNLSDLIIKLISNLQKQQPDRKIDFKIIPNIIVNADEKILRIAIENLINNAWKYTSKKDNSYIEFGTIKPDESSLDDTELIYFIKDNGIGFDMEKSQEIFTPFTRLHSPEEFEGSGIGLATVKKIINLHGGKIWYESQINQGATFYFTVKAW